MDFIAEIVAFLLGAKEAVQCFDFFEGQDAVVIEVSSREEIRNILQLFNKQLFLCCYDELSELIYLNSFCALEQVHVLLLDLASYGNSLLLDLS